MRARPAARRRRAAPPRPARRGHHSARPRSNGDGVPRASSAVDGRCGERASWRAEKPVGTSSAASTDDLARQHRVDRAQRRQRALVGDDLPERVDAAVGPARHGQRRPARAAPSPAPRSSSPATVRSPGWAAQPANGPPSYSRVSFRGGSDQLEVDHLGRVTRTRAELEDPRVAARAVACSAARSRRTACRSRPCRDAAAIEIACRRACRSPAWRSVISFSTSGLTALALASVVLMRSWSMTSTQRLASSALRCEASAGQLVAGLLVAHRSST